MKKIIVPCHEEVSEGSIFRNLEYVFAVNGSRGERTDEKILDDIRFYLETIYLEKDGIIRVCSIDSEGKHNCYLIQYDEKVIPSWCEMKNCDQKKIVGGEIISKIRAKAWYNKEVRFNNESANAK